MTAAGMDVDAVKEAYSRWASVYDWVFGPLFAPARRRAVERLSLARRDRVLEVGVGTGLSLGVFPTDVSFVGIDISRPMLLRALRRSGRVSGPRDVTLLEGDAASLPFPDDAFDAGLASYVVSAAPEPVPVMTELQRVCRPGARIVILNHFSSRQPVLAAVERLATGLTSRLLGFHAYFPLQPLIDQAALDVVREERVQPLWYWQVVTCRVGDGGTTG